MVKYENTAEQEPSIRAANKNPNSTTGEPVTEEGFRKMRESQA